MKRLMKWLLLIVAVLVVAVIIGAYGAVHYINSDKFKDDLVVKVREETGRTLTITGALEFSLYPWAGVTANGISLGNAPGFGDAPFFSAEQVALRIKTLPLLKKQYELDTLRLHGLEVNLAKNKEGVSNWDDLVKPKEEEPGEMPELSAVVLGGVDIKDSRLTFDDRQAGRVIKIRDLQAGTGPLTYGDPVELNLTMKAESSQPAISKDIALKAVFNYDLDAEIYTISPLNIDSVIRGKNVPGGEARATMNTVVEMNMAKETASVRDLTVQALGTELKANFEASDVQSGRPAIKADLNLSGEDLARLMKVLEIEPLASDLAKLKDRSFKVSTHIESDLSQDTVAIPELSVTGLGAEINGNLDVRNLKGDSPSAKGRLAAKGSDFPLLLQLASQFMGGDAAQLSELGSQLGSDQGKDFEVTTEFDADMTQGRIDVPALSARIPGASLNGKLQAEDINSDNPSVQGDLTAEGPNLPNVLQMLAGLQGGNAAAVKKATAGLKDKGFKVAAVFDSGDDGSIELSSLKFNGLQTSVDGTIAVSNLKAEAPRVKGRMEAKGSNLPLIIQVTGALQPQGEALITLGQDLAKSGSNDFTINSQFDADLGSGAISVPALTAKLLGASIDGALNATGKGDAVTLKGQLKATGSDLPSLMRLVGNLQKGESALGEAGSKLSAMKAKGFEVDTAFTVNQKAGDYDLSRLSARALGLEIDGALKAKGFKGSQGTINGNLTVVGNAPADLLTAYDQKDLAQVLKAVNLQAGIDGSGGNIQLKPFAMKATLAGKDIPNSPVDLNLTGDVSANLDQQTLSIKNLSLKGLGLDASGNVEATKIQEAPEFKGTMTVAPFNLRQFMKQLNQEPPATADKEVLKNVSFTSQFAGSATSIAFNELSIGLDDTQIKGDASVVNFAKPAITFGFGINQINFDRYLPPVATSEKAAPATPETAAAGAAQLPLDTLRALDIDGKLLVGSMVYSNLKMSNVKLAIKAKDGKIKLSPAQADLYQGSYEGNVTLDATGKLPKLTMNTNFKGVEIEPLMKDFQGTANLKGNSNINLALFSAGSDAVSLKRNLNGQGGINITNGVFQGVDVRKVLTEVEMMIEDKRIGKPTEGGETAFDRMSASLDINSGVVTNKDLILSGPGFKVTGEGMLANLNDETWKYNLTLAVDETTATTQDSRYNIGGYDIPVQCRGKIQDKRCVPNVGDVLGTVVQKSLTEKLLEKAGIKKEKSTAPAPAPDSGTTTQPKQEEESLDPGKLLEKGLKGLFD